MEVVRLRKKRLPEGGLFQYKEMENGEERRRVTFPFGARVSETSASEWNPATDTFPWQDAHYHQGLTEHYLVQFGWAGFLFLKGDQPVWEILKDGQHIVFLPLVPHVVLMGPGSVMVTITVGEPMGNPDRKGDDWWPYDDPILAIERLRLEAEHF